MSYEQDCVEWDAIEDAWDERVELSATVQLALRFSEDARVQALRAEEMLLIAQRRAEAARAYLHRTTTTLEQALRLYAMGRS